MAVDSAALQLTVYVTMLRFRTFARRFPAPGIQRLSGCSAARNCSTTLLQIVPASRSQDRPPECCLLQQSATRSTLRRTGNLAAIDHYVRAHRVRKAIVPAGAVGGLSRNATAAGGNAPGYKRAFPAGAQNIAPHPMNFFLDRHR